MMRALLRFSVQHPRLILGAVIALSLASAILIPRVRLRLDARSLVPANHPDLAASDEAASIFGPRETVLVGIVRKDSDIFNPSTLARIVRLSQELARLEGIAPSSVTSIAAIPRLFINDNRMDLRPLITNGAAWQGADDEVRHDVETLGLNDG